MATIEIQTHQLLINHADGGIELRHASLRMEHNPLRNLPELATGELGQFDEHKIWRGSNRYYLVKPNATGRRYELDINGKALI